jgi:hypothetical protein
MRPLLLQTALQTLPASSQRLVDGLWGGRQTALQGGEGKADVLIGSFTI